MLFSAPGARVLNNCISQAGYRIVKVKSYGRFSSDHVTVHVADYGFVDVTDAHSLAALSLE